ncbi:metallophosphoesterase [Parabacteroides gordonii]|mgnify:FL=1|jgi:predicted phosphodiesterase|uniref:metallophosphoesterase family protein n=1 Tax=Parabacteroides gordonii TaxID=574930 RepID=UPI00241E1196|nr:metallophosphoesterase [Parabacteroides gordonii]
MKHLFLSLLVCLGFTACQKETKPVTFAVVSDLHQDIAHDAEERLGTFLRAANDSQVDFIIELGDFCMPKEENKPFLKRWLDYAGEKYMLLGNHDMDNCSKEEVMQFIGMNNRYYSFDKGDFHFVILDPNNIYDGEKYIPYENGNYFGYGEKVSYVDPEQVEWLKKDLQATDKRCIIFSHQSFECSSQNREEIRKIFEDENLRAGYKKVAVAFSGHDHTNYMKEINGIAYIQINSASNQWVGEKYACPERFSDEINQKRPALKYTLPYKDALYGIVTLTGDGMQLKGVKSEFIAPGPEELGITDRPQPLVPWIEDLQLTF